MIFCQLWSDQFNFVHIKQFNCLCPLCLDKCDVWSCQTLDLEMVGRSVSMLFFTMFHAQRVGEAANPGPCRVAVVNPTAILKKVSDLLALDARVICVSETSATCITQQQVTKAFWEKKYRSFWSLPVQNRQETLDLRPSFRGESLGTAIFTCLPSRTARVDIPLALANSIRFNASSVRFHDMEVLVVSIYGFPSTCRVQDGVRMNNLLLTYTWDIVQKVGLPFLVCGDFNEPPESLPVYQMFRDIGAIEANRWFLNKFGTQLPATCKGATRNDTVVLRPVMANYLANVSVVQKHDFDAHSPMLLDFDFDVQPVSGITWQLPQSWAPFAPPAELIEKHYNALQQTNKYPVEAPASSEDGMHALLTWSKHVEHAVDLAIQEQRSIDPLRFPWTGLPQKFRGRCDVPLAKSAGHRSSVGGDRPGGYVPPCEIFSVAAKLKTKQVRRLMSLYRSLKATSVDDTRKISLLEIEWSKIKRAAGYGRSWSWWILGFEAVPFCPQSLPTCEFLDVAIAVTKVDCDYACHREYRNRQKSFRYRLDLDRELDFGKLSFKIMRGSLSPCLQEVPAQRECEAMLLRAVKGQQVIKILSPTVPPFHVNSVARFGDARIHICSIRERIVQFRVLDGSIPRKGLMSQSFVACDNAGLFQEFHKFWTPYWLKDSYDSQFDDSMSGPFQDLLDETAFPEIPPIHVPVDDVDAWFNTVKELKNGKAHGPCAWRHEELKALPKTRFVKLAWIFKHLQNFSFSGFMMKARTILLPKKDNPSSMNQIRPITIISALFRLFSKIAFKSITSVWKDHLPWSIMGGLPQRGAKDLALFQKLRIEESLASDQNLGGFSLDLVKAFNTFKRSILYHAMAKLQVPETIVRFWINSLSHLVRHPQVNGLLGPGIESTVGAPEGDSMSIISMIALSSVFYFRRGQVHESIAPFSFADNWSWMSVCQRAHVRAMQTMLNITTAMGVTVDFQKSWHWGTSKPWRQVHEHLQLLFPAGDVEILVQQHVKDLGEVVCYNKMSRVDHIRARVDEAIKRIHRLRRLPCPLQDKFKMIQTGAWPVALYAAEHTYIGKQHFQDLRKAVTFAVVGKRHYANAWITCAFVSKYIVDPQLHVLMNALRHLRRLASSDPDRLTLFLQLLTDFQGCRPFGPASTLRVYLENVGWSLAQDGTLRCGVYRCHVWTDSFKCIRSTLLKAWPAVVLNNLDRKGTGEFLSHPHLTASVFSSF